MYVSVFAYVQVRKDDKRHRKIISLNQIKMRTGERDADHIEDERTATATKATITRRMHVGGEVEE